MLTRIHNLPGTVLRHAENADTRQEIQREDPVFERRKKKGAGHDVPLDEIADIAEVSVGALIAFIEAELAHYQRDAVQLSQPEGTDMPVDAPAAPVNPVLQQAARAYGGGQTPAPAPQPVHSAPASDDALNEEGQKILRRHLQDLKILRDNLVETLIIRRAGSFLDSLGNAISEKMAAI